MVWFLHGEISTGFAQTSIQAVGAVGLTTVGARLVAGGAEAGAATGTARDAGVADANATAFACVSLVVGDDLAAIGARSSLPILQRAIR